MYEGSKFCAPLFFSEYIYSYWLRFGDNINEHFYWIRARPNSPETFLELVEGVDVCL
jgi:hypothetical protein